MSEYLPSKRDGWCSHREVAACCDLEFKGPCRIANMSFYSRVECGLGI